MQNILEKNYKIIVAIILAVMFVISVFGANNDSAIFDETAHIGASFSYVTEQDMRLNPEHPPLIKDLAGFPLLLLGLNFNTDQKFWTEDVNGQWEAGRSLLYHSGNDADRILFWSRLPIILLSLILGLFIFKWTRELAGIAAGLFALVLYAYDPNILGHNHYVTTDIGIAAFTTFSFYYFLKFIKNPGAKNIILAGLFLGLVQLAKFSSVITFPVLGLALILYAAVIAPRNEAKKTFSWRAKTIFSYLWKGAAIFAISFVVVWIVYFFNTHNMPAAKLTEAINFYFSPQDSNSYVVQVNEILTSLNNRASLRPFSEYLLGVAMVFKRVAGGNGVYYLGQVSGKAFTSYFPVVFAIKETLPAMFLMLAALIIASAKLIKSFLATLRLPVEKIIKTNFENIKIFLRHKIAIFALFMFIVLYSYVSITGNLNIGFRHLFPILPFVYILTAKVIFDFIKKIKDKYSKAAFGTAVLVLSFFIISETASAYPYYMSYFNQIGGGPKNGYHYVTDSNADWGQDLKRLRDFLDDHPEINKIRVDYFGGGDIEYYLGDKYVLWWDSKRPIEPGWYAISTNFLQGSIYDKTKKDDGSYRWILRYEPMYQVGTSILIYHIE
jgi:hypothetical protein